MTGWSAPPFDTLPHTSDPQFRLVNCIIMDAEQYRVECWKRRDGPGDYWRPSTAGRLAYTELRYRRSEERKTDWQTRMDIEGDA